MPEIVKRIGAVAQDDEARRLALEYLSSQVEQVILRLDEIEAQNDILRAEKAALEWQLGEVKAAHRSLDQAFDATTQEKQRELDALNEQLAALTAELESERELRDKLRNERDRLQGQLDAKTSAHGVLERAFETSEQRAAKQLADLQHQLAALTVELENERAVRDALARQSNELADTVAALSRERSELTDELKTARGMIAEHDDTVDRQRVEIAMLSSQVAALRADLKLFREALATAKVRDLDQNDTIEQLGRRLNAALAARVRELSKYRSDFFGRLREVLGERADVRIAGDRFVLQSELLFASGSAQVGRVGRRELVQLGAALKQLAGVIPDDVDWILRVDGHTDRVPIVTDDFASNWELSTARAVAVVQFLVKQGIPPHPPGRDRVRRVPTARRPRRRDRVSPQTAVSSSS